jgi:TonB family protein
MKSRAVHRISLLSSLLFAGSWPLIAEAVPKAPVTAYCQDALGRNVECPPPPKPAAGATARRAYLRSFGHDLRDKQVVRLEGGSFQTLTPAEWYSDDEDAAQGWCVAQVDEQPVQRTRFYHLWLDEKSCLATRKEAIRPEPFDPFKAYAKDRIICDAADSLKCDQAAKRFASLAATDLEHATDFVFEYPTIVPELRQRFARRLQFMLTLRERATILINEWPCIGISPGGLLCGNVFHTLKPWQYTFVSESRSLPTGAWRYRVMKDLVMRRCHVDDAQPETFTLFIENDSNEPLECHASLAVSQRSPANAGPLLIEPRERRVALEQCSWDQFSSADVKCAPRAPVSPVKWDLPPGCSFSILSSAPIEYVYPKGSIFRGEEGTVNVSFRVDKQGRHIDGEVVSGSDLKPLQEAALRYVRLLRVRATCPDVRYLTQVHFRLDDFGRPRELPRSELDD